MADEPTAEATAKGRRSVGGPAHGRRPRHEELAILERVESLLVTGQRVAQIRRALANDANMPVTVSDRQVERYIAQVRADWERRSTEETVAQARSERIAAMREHIRVLNVRAARYAGSNLGAAYYNSLLRAEERLAKLLGADAALRVEHSGAGGGPIKQHIFVEPTEELTIDDLRARMDAWSDDETAAGVPDGEDLPTPDE